MPPYKKIRGFNPPSGIPKDFATQVESVISKHNRLIDDCLSCKQSLEELQKNHRILSKQYSNLKEVSEKLAEKYETLIIESIDTDDKKDNYSSTTLTDKIEE